MQQRGEGSRNLKAAAMAVSQEEDCEGSLHARVFPESVTGLAMAVMFFWHAQTEARVRELVFNISQDAVEQWWVVVGTCLGQ
jgi:hypothetical protein